VDPERNELRRGEEVQRLEPKVIEVLAHLAARPDRVVPRDELLAAVWPGVVVGDDALTQAIIKLRKALGDDAHRPKYIETISKRGYRLLAKVTDEDASAPALEPSRRRPLGAAQSIGLVVAGFAAAAALTAAVRMPWPLVPDTRGGAATGVSIPIVAVLPLANLGEEPKREYFSDGVTEDIIAALGRFSGVRVMSRNAVQSFKGKVPPLQAIREQLGVRYIVQGSVRESAGKLRVAVELSDAEKGVLLWADRYDGEGSELFAIQDRIVRNIVGTLHVKLTQIEQARVFSKPTESLEAYDLMLRAKSLVGQYERRNNREARQLLARAAELAPGFTEVAIVLGEAEIQRALYGWVEDPAEPMKRAEELAMNVLNSPDSRNHARAHYLLSRIYSNVGRSEDALVEAERAVEGNPSDSTALYWRGVSLLYVGKVHEGLAVMEAARRLDPLLNEGNGFNLTMGYFTAGRYRESLELADQLALRFPRDIALHTIRAANYSELGDLEKARAAAEQVRRLNPYFNVEFTGTRFVNPEHRRKLQEALRKAGL
jgi:TolB-like protein/DNA-binding winged helix-turn-helix (wHTH) protein/Tfp pilus assembly protein PilF